MELASRLKKNEVRKQKKRIIRKHSDGDSRNQEYEKMDYGIMNIFKTLRKKGEKYNYKKGVWTSSIPKMVMHYGDLESK